MAGFTILFPGSSATFVNNAGSAIKGQGGQFAGDADTGLFQMKTALGEIKGNYKIEPGSSKDKTQIVVSITKKPFLVPISKIEQAINGYLK